MEPESQEEASDKPSLNLRKRKFLKKNEQHSKRQKRPETESNGSDCGDLNAKENLETVHEKKKRGKQFADRKSKPTAKKLSAKNCERCGKIFTSQRNLRKHIESVHEGKRNFSCGHCDKKYAQSKDLSSHISRIHQNQQHNKCPHCDINFASKHILQKHIEVLHDKKKPFTCNNCDKTFGAKLGLQRHAKNCNNLKLI